MYNRHLTRDAGVRDGGLFTVTGTRLSTITGTRRRNSSYRLSLLTSDAPYESAVASNSVQSPTTDRDGPASSEVAEGPSGDRVEDATGVSHVVVGIPAYNEEYAIGSTVLGAHQHVDEVVVVDDGSTDQTARRALQAGAKVLVHDENRGKGAAVKTLFEYGKGCDCDVLVVLDGDGQHLPNDIPKVAAPILGDETDIVIGSRYLENDPDGETPRYRRVGQYVLDLLTVGSTGESVTDSQSGFRAFSASAIESLPLQSDGYSVESEMISSAVERGLEIEEIPIGIRYDGIDGQTYNPIHHGFSIVLFFLRLFRDKHPLVFFGVPGILLTIAGTLYGLDAILIYQSTGEFYPAKVLVGGFTTIVGILGVFCGLILNRISNMIAELKEVAFR